MPQSFDLDLSSILGKLKGPGKAPDVDLPKVDPNPTIAKSVFENVMDIILGGAGIKDGLGPDATPGAGIGMAMGTLLGAPGWYSRVGKAVKGLPAMVHPNKALSVVKNLANPEEAEWRGLTKFLTEKGDTKIPRADIEAHLAANPLKVDAEKLKPRIEGDDWRDDPYAAWEQYTLPGGENYSETLFSLPDHPANYQSHAHDTPNMVSWSREKDRVTPEGTPIRFIEENQSDWHQKGAKQGYGLKPEQDAMRQAADQRWATADEELNILRSDAHRMLGGNEGVSQDSTIRQIAELQRVGGSTERVAAHRDLARRMIDADRQSREARQAVVDLSDVIPDAPFKQAWPDLAVKHHILEAAKDPKLEGIGWTTGQTQADRYPDETNVGGLKDFYDRQMVDRTNKLLRPFGGKVEEGSVQLQKSPHSARISGGPEPHLIEGRIFGGIESGETRHVASSVPRRSGSGSGDVVLEDANSLARHMDASRPAPTTPAWIAKLTPEMKKAIIEKGFPLLSLIAMMEAQAKGQK